MYYYKYIYSHSMIKVYHPGRLRVVTVHQTLWTFLSLLVSYPWRYLGQRNILKKLFVHYTFYYRLQFHFLDSCHVQVGLFTSNDQLFVILSKVACSYGIYKKINFENFLQTTSTRFFSHRSLLTVSAILNPLLCTFAYTINTYYCVSAWNIRSCFF